MIEPKQQQALDSDTLTRNEFAKCIASVSPLAQTLIMALVDLTICGNKARATERDEREAVDHAVGVLETLTLWGAEEWSELFERNPPIVAIVAPLLAALPKVSCRDAYEAEFFTGMSDPSEWSKETKECTELLFRMFERGWQARAAQQVQADAGAIYQVQNEDGHWIDTNKRHYEARLNRKFKGESRILYAHPSPAAESDDAPEITEETAMRVALQIIAKLEDRSGVLDGIDDETMSEITDEIAVTITTELQGGV